MGNTSEKPKVFISYVREDKEIVDDLYDNLRESNCDPWLDETEFKPGTRWKQGIEEAIEKSDFFISCFSSKSINKRGHFWVELGLAIKETERRPIDQIYFIPARFDECDLPRTTTEFQIIDLYKENGIDKLLKVIQGEFQKQGKYWTPVKIDDQIIDEENTRDAPPDDKLQYPEYRYENLFRITSHTIPYISLLGIGRKGDNEFRKGDILSQNDLAGYQLPADFHDIPIPVPELEDRESKCRLLRYDHVILPHPNPDQLTFTFSKIGYEDYLKSGEHLDDSLPENPDRTFRDKYAPAIDVSEFTLSPLTNICGVGIFILTRDGKIIISRHSSRVIVFSNVWSYSASGTMDWKENVHPFDEVARECWEEIRHEIKMDG